MARMTVRLLGGGMLAVLLGACSDDLSLNSVTFKPEALKPTGTAMAANP